MCAFLLPLPAQVVLDAWIPFAFLAYSLANPSREYPRKEIRLNCAWLRSATQDAVHRSLTKMRQNSLRPLAEKGAASGKARSLVQLSPYIAAGIRGGLTETGCSSPDDLC